MTVRNKIAIASLIAIGFAGSAFAKPSRALVSFAQQAAATSIAPTNGILPLPVMNDPVTPPTVPTGPTITPNLPTTVNLLPITIRPPFRPDIRSPFTP